MAIGNPAAGDYDQYVDKYLPTVARREQGDDSDAYGILPYLLPLLGDLAGKNALDAGCGEGYLARILAARGARVAGIDLSPNMIKAARAKDPGNSIDYRVADLSQPLPPQETRTFDIVASYLALNDVVDYRGFIATIAAALKPRGRMAIALNNPYGAVIRRHVADYFNSGRKSPYRRRHDPPRERAVPPLHAPGVHQAGLNSIQGMGYAPGML